MARFKVALADTPAREIDLESQVFQASGLDVETVQRWTRDPEGVVALAADAQALMLCWAPVTREVLAALPQLRVVVRFGIGVDNIDLDAATDHGVLVCNTARFCLDEVSNHTIALLLALNRQLVADVDTVRRGGWSVADRPMPRRLAGQALGLVGLGNIGRAVATKARALGLRLAAHDPYLARQHREIDGVPLVDLEDLLRTSDFVSIHCPLNASTRRLIGARELALMKPSAYLINTARGGIIDQAALVAALAERRIAGAALDVMEVEPLPADDPLRRLDNVILTPHTASRSLEAWEECRRTAAAHVVAALRGEVPTDVVNRAVLASPRLRIAGGSSPPTPLS